MSDERIEDILGPVEHIQGPAEGQIVGGNPFYTEQDRQKADTAAKDAFVGEGFSKPSQ